MNYFQLKMDGVSRRIEAYGLQNDIMKATPFGSKITTLDCKTNRNNTILRIGDTIKIIGIQIKRDRLIDLCDLSDFEIEIGGTTFWEMPMELLLSLSKVTKTKENFIIIFPPKLFSYVDGFQIPIIALRYHDVVIRINSEINLHFELLLQTFMYNESIRKQIGNERKMSYHAITTYYPEKFDNMKIIRPFVNNLSPGFFLKTDSEIDYVKVTLNGDELFCYHSNILQHVCGKVIKKRKKWNKGCEIVLRKLPICDDVLDIIIEQFIDKEEHEYLYWIPWDFGVNWNDDMNNGKGSVINMSRIEYFQIEFNKPISGYTCFVTYDIMKVLSGMTTTYFSLS